MTRLTVFAGGVFAIESGFFAVIPPLIPRLAREVNLSTAEVGVLVAAYPAGVVIGALPSITLVERLGVRWTVFTGLGLLVVATVGFALGSSGPVLDGARLVQGLGGAVAWGGALAWLTGTASEARRGAVIGGAIGAALIGTVFGPTLGAVAADHGRLPVFGALAGLLVLLALAAPASAPAPNRVQGAVRAVIRLLRNRPAVVGNVALFVIGVAGGTSWSLTPLLIARLGGGAAVIGGMVALGYLLAAMLNVVVGPLTDRIGRLGPTITMLLVAAVLLPWLPRYSSLIPLLITGVVAGATLSGLWTPTAAMVADSGESNTAGQAVAVATMNVFWAGGGAIGPVVMASLAQGMGFTAPFLGLAGLCAACALFAAATYRRKPLRQAGKESTWTSG